MAAPIYDPLGWNAPGNTLQDLYNWYQTGGDEDTTTTSPATGGITSAYYPPEPFDRRQATSVGYVPEYLPRDAEGFQIQPDSGVYSKQYTGQTMPDGTPIMSGYTEEEEDPNLLQRFGTGIRDFVGGITSAISAPNILSRLGRPADAIYTYPGDVTGYGSRAGLTPEEVRNMELVESMGGVDDLGKDKYGINLVSAFGNYTTYNENRVAELKGIVASQKKRGLKDTIQMQELEDRTGVQEGIEEDEEEKMERIQKINEMKKLGYTEPSIVSPITALKTSPIQAAKDAAAEQAAFERDVIAADVRRDFQQAVAAPTTSAYTGGLKSPGHPANQGGGGFGKGDDPGGGTRGSPFQKGGRVRYGNGGIVDLL